MKQGLPCEIGSMNDNSESVSSVQSHVSKRSRRSNRSRISNQSSKMSLLYQLPKRLSPNFNTIEQADIETASKLCDIAFATTDQNAQRQKLMIEDEIEYEKIKTDTLIEQTQHNLDHDDEIIEIENARLKAENEAAL